MRVKWSDTLASGNETIDSQHMDLFDHINAYFSSLEKPYEGDVTIKTLNFLVKYVRFHFGTEEEMMKSSSYPEFKEHLAAHRKLVDELMACYNDMIREGSSEEVVERIRVLLQEWFVGHIMVHDTKLAKYLRENDKSEN